MFLFLNSGAKVALKVKCIYTISFSYYAILINCRIQWSEGDACND